jgi:hypothetical protein
LKVLPKRQNKTDDWLTPPELVRSLGAFDLDPCGSTRQTSDLAVSTYRLPDHNGLLEPWHGRVWCNPPFSQMKAWAQRFAVHNNGIMVCPMRFRYRWTDVFMETADAILLLRDTIRWINSDGLTQLGNIFDMMLVAYGPGNTEALRWSGLAGTLVTTRERLPLKKPLTSTPDEVEFVTWTQNTGNKPIQNGVTTI